MLHQYGDIFSAFKGDVGRTGLVKHKIDTGNARPIKQPPRRLPFAKREIEKAEVEKMLKQGIIQPSTSPWASPVVLVGKRDGTTRFCVDYRKLNEVTLKDAYPLPRPDDLIDSLADAKWFSTMDLSSGYWQVEMDPESRAKTAFATSRNGLFEFSVMAFGLANAPSTFERLMEGVLKNLAWEECLVYLDDIISFGTTFEQELARLMRIFDRLRAANLKLKPSKCHFFQTGVDFLGHHVSRDGVHTSQDKTEAVRDWPVPRNVKEVKSFYGLCTYYRKFVQNFAQIARPLTNLVRKNEKFHWTPECQQAFEGLKEALTTAPVLAYPRPDGDLILDTDASQFAVGSVLSQRQPDGQVRVVAYASKILNSHERRYCTTRKEMLAVVTALRKFKTYLWGRPILLRTDNAAVNYMLHIKEPEGQLARWLEELGCYNLQVTHRPGRSHGNADALSRRPCRQCGRNDEAGLKDGSVPDSRGTEGALPERSTQQEVKARRGEISTQDEAVLPVDKGRRKPTDSSSDVQPCMAVTRQQQQQQQAQHELAQQDGILPNWDRLELHDGQVRDPEIGLIMAAIEDGQGRPPWAKVASESQAVKTLWGQWNRLSIRNTLLYRRWEDESGQKVRWQLVVPVELRHEVLQHTHDSPAAGHMGVHRTIERVRQGFFWPGIKRDVRCYCRQCDACTARKLPDGAPRVPLQEYVIGTPNTRVSVDLTGPLPETQKGNKYILVMADHFDKWCECVALPSQEAGTVARAVAEKWICRWGAPFHLHSDQGRQFESQLFHDVMKWFGVKKTRATSFHAQSNGMVERLNKTIKQMLTIYTKDCPDRWDESLQFMCMAYNSSVHSTTGFSPFRLRCGEEMRLPIHVMTGDPNEEVSQESVVKDYRTYLDELKDNLKKAHDIARKVTRKNVKVYKDHYDVRASPREFQAGQPVWLYKPQRTKGVCPKLQCKWDKVYIITHRLDDVLYRVQKGQNGKGQVVHIQRLMPYHGRNPPTWWKPPCS